MTLQVPSGGKSRRGRPRSAVKGDTGRLSYDLQVSQREDSDRRLAERLNSSSDPAAPVFVAAARRAKAGDRGEAVSAAEGMSKPKSSSGEKAKAPSKPRTRPKSRRGSKPAPKNRRTASEAGS